MKERAADCALRATVLRTKFWRQRSKLQCLGVAAVIMGGLSPAIADEGIPANSHQRASGAGWTCDRGYHRIDQSCSAIDLPENAYLNGYGYGRGWD